MLTRINISALFTLISRKVMDIFIFIQNEILVRVLLRIVIGNRWPIALNLPIELQYSDFEACRKNKLNIWDQILS